MTLINLSNHPSNKWCEEQKHGWDEIIDVQFPNISPESNTDQIQNIVDEYMERIKRIPSTDIMLQGEYTFCYLFIKELAGYTVWIPTTERKVIEYTENNNVIKQTIFKFAQWRKISV